MASIRFKPSERAAQERRRRELEGRSLLEVTRAVRKERERREQQVTEAAFGLRERQRRP